MNQMHKEQIEDILETSVKNAMKDNPMEGTPFAAMMIHHALATSSANLKDNLKANKSALNLNEEEIDQLVDEITKKVHNKYLTIRA